jgi:hypothetical protein
MLIIHDPLISLKAVEESNSERLMLLAEKNNRLQVENVRLQEELNKCVGALAKLQENIQNSSSA